MINQKQGRSQIILLLVWTLLGTCLRVSNLTAKPPWADEWATLVFSLGNSFLTVPLNQLISINDLLQPLQLGANFAFPDVVHNLLTESTHPPFYFLLTHTWLHLFSPDTSLVSVGVARSLSVMFGVIGIPASFGLAYLVTESPVCGQIAALLMAFSPYGIYLAQETRHYTLVILIVMASLTCLLLTLRHLRQTKLIPWSIILLWIVLNSWGVATHYFLALALVGEILVLVPYLLQDLWNKERLRLNLASWRRILLAVLGTVAGCSVWVWTWLGIPDNQLTNWIKPENLGGIGFIEPWGRLIGWISSMIVLLPIEGVPVWVTIISVLICLLLVIWLVAMAIKFWRQHQAPYNQGFHNLRAIAQYLLVALSLILLIVYFGDRDLTLAARFQFFYFPAVIILVASILESVWQKRATVKLRTMVILVLLISLAGSLSVVHNYAYQKPDRPDLVVPVIKEAQAQNPQIPILIATVYKTHEQTGEMMGLAWEWSKTIATEVAKPQFLLLKKIPDLPEAEITKKFHQQLAKLSRPFDVWVVNFSAPTGLDELNCPADLDYKRRVSGYRFRLLHCLPLASDSLSN